MKMLIKITFNKKFNFWEALTATADKEGNKIQKYGNDYNINSDTKESCRLKALEVLTDGFTELIFTKK